MQLYTNLLAFKMVLNDGDVPPMMKLPKAAEEWIDPEFTIGLGGIYEDEEKGLRCPVRGCGAFYHELTRHLNKAHGGMGGAARVRDLMGISASTPLISAAARAARVAARTRERRERGRSGRSPLGTCCETIAQRERRLAALRTAMRSVGYANLRDTCEEQTRAKIIALHHKLGRTPTAREAIAEFNAGITAKVEDYWGSWSNAIALLGLDPVRRWRYSLDEVMLGLREWVKMHGDLPTKADALRRDRKPFFATRSAVLRVFETESWTTAMEIAARMMGLTESRYLLSERERRSEWSARSSATRKAKRQDAA